MTAESSSVIFHQVLVPFWLAGLGTVTAGMLLDEIQVSADIVYVLIHLALVSLVEFKYCFNIL